MPTPIQPDASWASPRSKADRNATMNPTRCEATAPPRHTQAGARCEREAHADGNHKVAPKDGKPGAVWK